MLTPLVAPHAREGLEAVESDPGPPRERAALRFPQAKEVLAARVVERKLDQHLVTGRPAPTPQWHWGWREKRPSKPAPPQLAVRGESPARGTPRSRLAGQTPRASPPENAVRLQIFGEKSVLYLLCYSIQNL